MITEYPVPTAKGVPDRVAAGLDGALWFTEYNGNNIGRITTAGVVTEYPVPTASSGPLGIAAGPDGALWFTEAYANNIARITASGLVTEYPAPSASSYPYGITAGPDGEQEFSSVARAPACGLGLSASFANGTLTMNFNVGIDTTATWYANLRTSTGGAKQLWSKPISAVVPPDSFTRTFGPGFPDLGTVTIGSGVETAPGQGLCFETVSVNTGQ